MKSYLSLIPISARVHRRQNRMTLLCIIFSVFLVTSVFSMAEMGVRMEQTRLSAKHGSFTLEDITDSAMGQSLFLIAGILFFLILAAGVLMISGSMNSTVAQRTKFFGMMRCIGMSKKQIVHFVKLEALNWCKTAIPIGIALGIVTTWGLCAALRYLVGEEFSSIPLFGISFIGIASGTLLGIVTVLIAAGAPAKRAAKVSPVTAVSGSPKTAKPKGHGIRMCFFKIETALGISHAVSAGKNLILMTGSFALSIILFLSFSVLIDFVGYLMPQSASASDIEISSSSGSSSVDPSLLSVISGMDGVKRVYGRQSAFDVPAESGTNTLSFDTIDLISFGEFDLDCLKKDDMLKKGSDLSRVYGNSGYVLATWDENSSWKIGDQIQIGSETLEIAGLLKYDPFTSDGFTGDTPTLITSRETFVRLTGISGYSLLLIQTDGDITEENVKEIQKEAGDAYVFRDKRDQHTSGTYFAFVFCVYGFLAIITLVSVLNIVNSISMSVSARIKQYGSMRAVGMNGWQITKMIAAEALTYAFLGCAAGCLIGLGFSRLLYGILITPHFPYAIWSLPAESLLLILFIVFLAVAAAVYPSAKRMQKLSITETINEL